MNTPKQFDRNNFIWGSGGHGDYPREDIPLPNVTDQHLVNILNWVFARPADYNKEIYTFLEGEAQYRAMLLFAKGKPRPVKEGDQWVLK